MTLPSLTKHVIAHPRDVLQQNLRVSRKLGNRNRDPHYSYSIQNDSVNHVRWQRGAKTEQSLYVAR
jgi:hypothetical protein